MTLGLTSSGAVKIKTDGGLRAVNCACCGCPCPPPAGRWRIEGANFFGDPLNITERTDYNDYDPCGYFEAETAEGFSLVIFWECNFGNPQWVGAASVPPEYQGACDDSDYMSGYTSPEAFNNDPSIGIASGGYEFFCYGGITASKEP